MRRLLLAFPATFLLAFAMACSDDDDAQTPAGSPEPTGDAALDEVPNPENTGVPDGLQYVFDSVDGNITVEEMRPYLSDELAQRSDDEIADAIFCFPTDVVAEVTDMNIQEEGQQATLTVFWQVTGDAAAAEEQTVERTWEFERESAEEASGYMITGLPSECPFEASDPGGTQEPAIQTPEADDDN